MSHSKVFARKLRYRHVVLAFFTASVIVCLVGSVAPSIEYFMAFDTANQFNPHVLLLTKENVGDARIITVVLTVANPARRSIFLYEYGVLLTLNDEFIAQREVFPNLALEPSSNETLMISFVVTGPRTEYIVQAEQSGEWNWDVRYPMRYYVGWLFLVAEYLGEGWLGIQEVP